VYKVGDYLIFKTEAYLAKPGDIIQLTEIDYTKNRYFFRRLYLDLTDEATLGYFYQNCYPVAANSELAKELFT
jgi:hypothetical protein